MPPAPQNIQFSAGIIVGLAFRAFAYFLLMTAPSWFGLHNIPIDEVPLLPTTYWTLMFSSPLWVPFVSGFLSSYFWRRLSNPHYLLANRICMIAAGGGLFVWLCFLALVPFFLIGLVLVYLDERLGVSGMEHGERFWNHRRTQLIEILPQDGNVLTRDGDFSGL